MNAFLSAFSFESPAQLFLLAALLCANGFYAFLVFMSSRDGECRLGVLDVRTAVALSLCSFALFFSASRVFQTDTSATFENASVEDVDGRARECEEFAVDAPLLGSATAKNTSSASLAPVTRILMAPTARGARTIVRTRF